MYLLPRYPRGRRCQCSGGLRSACAVTSLSIVGRQQLAWRSIFCRVRRRPRQSSLSISTYLWCHLLSPACRQSELWPADMLDCSIWISASIGQRCAAMLMFSDPAQTPEVRQAAVYGLGACADGCGGAFTAVAASALTRQPPDTACLPARPPAELFVRFPV